jgi:hypothetical protein
MTDVEAVILEYLKSQPGLTVLTEDRIHASLYFPKGYKPADGQGLLFNIRGGDPDYTSLVLRPSVQFRSFGLTPALARELDLALYDVLNDKSYCQIKIARLEAIGQPLQDPAKSWPYVLSYYRFYISNS